MTRDTGWWERKTFKCPKCRDTGFLPGKSIWKGKHEYTTATRCDCHADRVAEVAVEEPGERW